MAGNGKVDVPNELQFEGVTLIFGDEMPAKTTGRGTTKYDPIIDGIRTHPRALAGEPVRMAGVKPSGVANLKKRYADILFETRGGKENPTVWATIKSTSEDLVDA